MKHKESLLTLAVILMAGSALAQGNISGSQLSITSVTIDIDTDQLAITGENFGNGGIPVVTLGNFGTLALASPPSDTLIEATLPADIQSGDYVLSVSTGRSARRFASFDMTVPGILSSPDGSFYVNTRGGTNALSSNTTGIVNTAYGFDALADNTTGYGNTGVGFAALRDNDSGGINTAFGQEALAQNVDGGANTAVGYESLFHNSTGSNNSAVGSEALLGNISGGVNAAFGWQALLLNTSGSRNTGIGSAALVGNSTGSRNTSIGYATLRIVGAGSDNIALGHEAGYDTVGDANIVIGNAGTAESNTIRIGNDVDHSRTFIAGIRGVATGVSDGVTVLIDSDGQLGTVSSSIRYKEDVNDMAEVSDRLLGLRPVTFRYKNAYRDDTKPIQYGLIAEEVAAVFPELVVYDDDRAPESVKYYLLSVLLLNELQKQHQVIEERKQAEAAILERLTVLESQVRETASLEARVAVPARLSTGPDRPAEESRSLR